VAYTIQQVVDRARGPLNDAAGTRYSDTDLLRYVNDCVMQLRRRRPDLFFGRYSALPGDKVISDALPIADEYMPAVVDYVIARAETRDDEQALQARAALFFQLFEGEVRGG